MISPASTPTSPMSVRLRSDSDAESQGSITSNASQERITYGESICNVSPCCMRIMICLGIALGTGSLVCLLKGEAQKLDVGNVVLIVITSVSYFLTCACIPALFKVAVFKDPPYSSTNRGNSTDFHPLDDNV